MKAEIVKNGADLSAVLSKMEQHMRLANYAESTIRIYTRAVKGLGIKLGKSLEKIEQEELFEHLLVEKERLSQSSFHLA